jgi:F0F1-type ATP synthase assembly protein I
MTETKTPETTPSPTSIANNSQVTVGKAEDPQSVFVGMALDMSWRLALVFLVPIVGGFELDSRLGTTPLLTILGFILAIIGVGLVMRQTVQAANKIPAPKAKREKKS